MNDLKKTKKANSVKQKLAEFGQKMKNAQAASQPELLLFLLSLGMEGERSAVVLGAERINVALEALLKKFLRPSPNEKDTLFTSDGPLGTFSRKIEMAYRLGLTDVRFKQSLGIIRRLRNDFAHAVKVESLSEQKHADKVQALAKLLGKENEAVLKGFYLAFEKSGEQAQIYLGCVMLLLVKLELVRHHLEPPKHLVAS